MDFWNDSVFGNPLWSWLVFVLLVGATGVAYRLTSWLLQRIGGLLTVRLKLAAIERIIVTVRRPLSFVVLLTGLYLALFSIRYDGASVGSVRAVGAGYSFLVTLCVITMLSRVYGELVAHLLKSRLAAAPGKVDDKLLPIAVTMGRVVIWSLGLLVALSNAGIDVSSLIAGLGIGGIAVAMAAKDTLANVFGGVSLFADKVFELGDEVTVRGITGNVERIGIRTTRIRTADDTILVVPNATVADSPIENLSHRRKRRQQTVLPLAYHTSHAQMQRAREAVHAVLDGTDGVLPQATVRFEEFGEVALRLRVIYWVADQTRFADLVDEVNSEILRRFDELDLRFAHGQGARAGHEEAVRQPDALSPLVDRMSDYYDAKTMSHHGRDGRDPAAGGVGGGGGAGGGTGSGGGGHPGR